MPKEIKKKRLYEDVIKSIEEKYQSGELKLGDKLPTERDLSTYYGVSRGTIRDAFRVLESHGIIEVKHGGGRYIRKSFKVNLDSNNSIISSLRDVAVLDLIEARKILEVGAMSLVCERVTDEDISKLRKLLETQSIQKFDEEGIDSYFHQAIMEITDNLILRKYLTMNIELINELRDKSFKMAPNYDKAHKEHIDILEAIESRDYIKAENAMSRHFNNIKARI